MAVARPAVQDPSPSLAQLVRTLGPTVLLVVAAIDDDQTRVREVVVYDPADPPRLRPGDLLLGVGLKATSSGFGDALSSAAAAGAAAVVVKDLGEDTALARSVAENARISLIAVSSQMRWAQLVLLLRQAIDATTSDSTQTVDVTDLFALANVIARMVGGAVTIEDAQNRVIAYSTVHGEGVDEPRKQSILGRQVPQSYLDLLRERGVFRELERGTGVVIVEPHQALGLRRRLALAVRAGDQVLGSLWVAEAGQPLHPNASTALLDAGRLAAVHLVRARSAGYETWQQREETLRQLLEGRADVRTVAESLGLETERGAAVLGIVLQRGGGPGANQEAYRRLGVLLATHAASYHLRVASAVAGTGMVALVPELSGDAQRLDSVVRRLAEGLASSAAKEGLSVQVAVGPVVPRLRDVVQSRAAVDEVLLVLSAEPARGPVASADDVRSAVVLRAVVELLRERPELHRGPVAELQRQDEKSGSNYLASLRAWLDCGGDVIAAAAQLEVHPNTLRYRLRRVADLSGLNLDDPAERMVASLHLMLAADDALR